MARPRAGWHPGGKEPAGKGPTLKEQGFYHSPAWRRARRLALQRDRYLCRLKLSDKCTMIATEVHHVQPIDSAPELALDLGNLVSCCWRCLELTKRRGSGEADAPCGVRVIRIRADGDR